ALFAGTLWLTNEMNIESIDGYLNVTGSHFKMTSKGGSDKYFEITPDGAHAHKGMFKVTRPDAYTDSDGKDWVCGYKMAFHKRTWTSNGISLCTLMLSNGRGSVTFYIIPLLIYMRLTLAKCYNHIILQCLY